MKSIIIYNTRSGNTKLFGEKMKEILEKNGHECQIFRDKQVKSNPKVVEPFDLLCLGTAIHAGGPAFFPFRGFIKKISQLNLMNKKLICFATSGDVKMWKHGCDWIKKKLPKLEHVANVGCVKKENSQAIADFENAVKKLK